MIRILEFPSLWQSCLLAFKSAYSQAKCLLANSIGILFSVLANIQLKYFILSIPYLKCTYFHFISYPNNFSVEFFQTSTSTSVLFNLDLSLPQVLSWSEERKMHFYAAKYKSAKSKSAKLHLNSLGCNSSLNHLKRCCNNSKASMFFIPSSI